jgi:hypothetical protein
MATWTENLVHPMMATELRGNFGVGYGDGL